MTLDRGREVVDAGASMAMRTRRWGVFSLDLVASLRRPSRSSGLVPAMLNSVLSGSVRA